MWCKFTALVIFLARCFTLVVSINLIKFPEDEMKEPGKTKRCQSSRATKSSHILLLNPRMGESQDGNKPGCTREYKASILLSLKSSCDHTHLSFYTYVHIVSGTWGAIWVLHAGTSSEVFIHRHYATSVFLFQSRFWANVSLEKQLEMWKNFGWYFFQIFLLDTLDSSVSSCANGFSHYSQVT